MPMAPIPAPNGVEEAYGYGWVIGEQFTQPRIWHRGSIEGFLSEIDRYPDHHDTIIVLSNREDVDLPDVTSEIARMVVPATVTEMIGAENYISFLEYIKEFIEKSSPFMLSLERLGKASLIDAYWEVFLLFGAAIQMIDDWKDLEGDLAIGHYSYVTLGFEDVIHANGAAKTARMLRENQKRVRETYATSKDMIALSRIILDRLNDRFLVRLVDITELRLDNYFWRDLKMR